MSKQTNDQNTRLEADFGGKVGCTKTNRNNVIDGVGADGDAVLRHRLADVDCTERRLALASSEVFPDKLEWFLFGFTNTAIEDAYSASQLFLQLMGCVLLQLYKLVSVAPRIARWCGTGANFHPLDFHAYLQLSLIFLALIMTVWLLCALKGRIFEWRRSLRALVAFQVLLSLFSSTHFLVTLKASDDFSNEQHSFDWLSIINASIILPFLVFTLLKTGFVINCIYMLAMTLCLMISVGLSISGSGTILTWQLAALIYMWYLEKQQRVDFLTNTGLRAELEALKLDSAHRNQEGSCTFYPCRFLLINLDVAFLPCSFLQIWFCIQSRRFT